MFRQSNFDIASQRRGWTGRLERRRVGIEKELQSGSSRWTAGAGVNFQESQKVKTWQPHQTVDHVLNRIPVHLRPVDTKGWQQETRGTFPFTELTEMDNRRTDRNPEALRLQRVCQVYHRLLDFFAGFL